MQGRKKKVSCLLLATFIAAPCAAQYAGSWESPFNHQVSTTIATDPGAPFGGLSGMTFYVFGGVTLGWPAPGGPMFNAVHMCLIPKGPHRGKVLVWDRRLILAKTPGFVTQGPDDYYSLQPWAIVDPDPQPGAMQFESFLLPIEPATVMGGMPARGSSRRHSPTTRAARSSTAATGTRSATTAAPCCCRA